MDDTSKIENAVVRLELRRQFIKAIGEGGLLTGCHLFWVWFFWDWCFPLALLFIVWSGMAALASVGLVFKSWLESPR